MATSNKKKPLITTDGGGLRLDIGKNQLQLIPPEWVWGLGEVLTYGATKYAPRNWERGMARGKMIACGLRHVYKFMAGERYDEESGCHHLFHAAWNFLALASYDLKDIGENDLPGSQDDGATLKAMLASRIQVAAPAPAKKRK